MKTLAILAAAAFASSISFSAAAADDTKAMRKQANDEYKADMKGCKPMKGKEEKACKEAAKSKRDQKLAEIKNERKAEKGSKSPSSGATSSSTVGGPATGGSAGSAPATPAAK